MCKGGWIHWDKELRPVENTKILPHKQFNHILPPLKPLGAQCVSIWEILKREKEDYKGKEKQTQEETVEK